MTAWTDMKPGHFDASLLPRVRMAAPGQGELFHVADVAPGPAPAGSPAQQEIDGQGDLFSD
jgi:hypothetical protein